MIWVTGLDPAAYFGWQGWEQQTTYDVMDLDTTAPDDDVNRKPQCSFHGKIASESVQWSYGTGI